MNTKYRIVGNEPDAAVIWLHGLGASCDDFIPAIPHLNLPENLSIQFIFPQAPVQPVTVNNGFSMPSWYDITAMLPRREIDEAQLLQSVNHIEQLIEKLKTEGVSSSRIIVVGFSQGGALAYEVALNSKAKVSAVAAMSTYLPRKLDIEKIFPINILSLHGELDSVVPIELGLDAVKGLEELGFKPEWRTFEMEHEVSLESLACLGAWITQCLEVKNANIT